MHNLAIGNCSEVTDLDVVVRGIMCHLNIDFVTYSIKDIRLYTNGEF